VTTRWNFHNVVPYSASRSAVIKRYIGIQRNVQLMALQKATRCTMEIFAWRFIAFFHINTSALDALPTIVATTYGTGSGA
jgi:hypothetical protein